MYASEINGNIYIYCHTLSQNLYDNCLFMDFYSIYMHVVCSLDLPKN